MAFRLKRRESIVAGVLRILNEQVAAIACLLRESSPGGPSGSQIHEARTRLKRLRALLRLVRGEFGGKVFAAADASFRDIGRRLAPMRSAAVQVATLDDLAARIGVLGNPPIERVRAALVAEVRRSRRGALTPAKRGALVSRLAETTAQLERVRFSHNGWPALRGGLHRTYRKGRKACAAFGDAPETAALHVWRKRVKELWYHLEILERVPARGAREMAALAKILSELLGQDHDLAMLDATLRVKPEFFGEPADLVEMHESIAARRRRLQEQCFRVGRRLYTLPTRRFLTRMERAWDEWWDGSRR